MQSESFNNMFGISLDSSSYTGPLRGSHDADVAHGEHEFDAPGVEQQHRMKPIVEISGRWVPNP